MPTLTFATRPSKLARWQTNHIAKLLQQNWGDLVCEEVVITTQGDKILDKPLPEIGGKGLFTLELEQALLDGQVDAAVHSLKDLPTENAAGLTVGLIPKRADPSDVLVTASGQSLDELPSGATVGTSSLRRQAQLLAYRSDLNVKSIRGNVGTRIRKLEEGQYDAIILAAAGVYRLGLEQHITQHIPMEILLPAPGQGALAVQCRADDEETLHYLSVLADQTTQAAVTAERTFLAALGGGCSIPVGAYATKTGDGYHLEGVVAKVDGKTVLRVSETHQDPVFLGEALAKKVLQMGAREVLDA